MIGSFAGVVFRASDKRVLNFSGLKRDGSARFAQHEVINDKPLKEFLGPGANSVSFTIELSAFRGVNPKQYIDKLHKAMTAGKAANFVLGGKVMGKYVIVTMSESFDVITNRGGIVSAKVDLSLEEYR